MIKMKQMMKGVAIGAAVLTMGVSSAIAAPIEVNIYGASAQYSFWTAAAPKYLLDATNGYGCGAGTVFFAANKTEASAQKRDAGIAICNGASPIEINGATVSLPGTPSSKETVMIRYTTNASYDGIYAIKDDNTFAPDEDKAACGANGGQRLMGNPVGATFNPYTDITSTPGNSIPNLVCGDVHIGASDVAAETFGQQSKGFESHIGQANGGSDVEHSFYNIEAPSSADYGIGRPIVVPFAFFANNAAGTAVPFDDITRPMAVNLFAGNIADWNQFGVDGDGNEFAAGYSLPVTVCLRHAGSGTHATLDAAVMRGDANLPLVQIDGFSGEYGNYDVADGLSPTIFFNKGSSEEIRCVGTIPGAIGYADSDKCGNAASTKCKAEYDADHYGFAKPLKYNGVPAEVKYVTNGQYDFWSAQWMYYELGQDNTPAILNLISYASDSDNMPANKAEFWAAQDDMKFNKTDDFKLPTPVSQN